MTKPDLPEVLHHSAELPDGSCYAAASIINEGMGDALSVIVGPELAGAAVVAFVVEALSRGNEIEALSAAVALAHDVLDTRNNTQ